MWLCVARFKRAFFQIGACLLILLLCACSMQKPGSKLDSSRSENKAKPAGGASAPQVSHEQQASLRVDYLTPLSAIKAPKIYVYKEKRRLYVIDSQVLVRDYPIGLGSRPKGDKEKNGDGKTPEGEFTIYLKSPYGQPARSLVLNYPGKAQAERGFFAGILTPMEFRDIVQAYQSGMAAPSAAKLGEPISILSGGAHQDWTDGSIALYNSDMEELFKIASVGTPVTIKP